MHQLLLQYQRGCHREGRSQWHKSQAVFLCPIFSFMPCAIHQPKKKLHPGSLTWRLKNDVGVIYFSGAMLNFRWVIQLQIPFFRSECTWMWHKNHSKGTSTTCPENWSPTFRSAKLFLSTWEAMAKRCHKINRRYDLILEWIHTKSIEWRWLTWRMEEVWQVLATILENVMLFCAPLGVPKAHGHYKSSEQFMTNSKRSWQKPAALGHHSVW